MEWLGPRGRDGGIDTVPLPVPTGGLSLCGKHAIAPDVAAAMAKCGATTVVCLVDEREVAGHWPHYAEWLHANTGGAAVWFPIHDLNAPPLERVTPLLQDLLRRIDDGEHLLVHCAAGIGRAGTLAACLLVRLGMEVDAALALVRASRPMAGPEVGPQLDLVKAVAELR
jgi:protein-tyrosine phosphatase